MRRARRRGRHVEPAVATAEPGRLALGPMHGALGPLGSSLAAVSIWFEELQLLGRCAERAAPVEGATHGRVSGSRTEGPRSPHHAPASGHDEAVPGGTARWAAVEATRWSPAYALGLVTFRRRDAACAAAVGAMDASLCSSTAT